MIYWKAIIISLLCLLGWSFSATGQPSNYIEKYKDIAVREMHRSGIPASITLAQGILESSWGNGALAIKANNHFGIKCKRHWTGETFYIQDDDYKNGKLIKSCFRSYENAEASYIDHTNFLMNNDRYSILFTYAHTDYRNWAFGLKKCGYATDKKYAYKLIRTIEEYNLSQFDKMPDEVDLFVNNSISRPSLKKKKQMTIATIPEVNESDIPAPFQLPDDYKRGSGLARFSEKGQAILQENSTILWTEKNK